ncbi:lipopolysaccharide transport periplasmic protein LptA [Pseudidiomarina terrestris]|uniref:Lipopolysaccharide export system protein LptA n=1 Tax=Pseudidiomarina terrestris TaxID=2820060 RepID=A0AAW7QVR6_9GAMM|nr:MULTISPECIES: lipopolysaccharide transport periplasmic protein LptA [unclassified Pseudidiomarina]MDN7124297.1 lipopolysaccharide transport periplasmic protein LptA [Pseudidiomarina sp. 1APP75-32.1]MDN7126298.1 lipopolysaccharide transport periplasmic protein LptA [Pseudidiomarina sp. 1APR75-33.1]MDN7129412.1 lipopolysaccharide transport periplasmic protein LptA [Pseudidiomarina sp. 1APR75-15]MDN7134323.1 lipopolysaccharide transport periplasmic protein LptA [Pseudidiomarina sp. 1ASP75-5]MD
MYKLPTVAIAKQFFSAALVLLAAALFSPTVAAQGKADFEQDIKVDSEREWFDIQNKIAVFEDNAVITQGTLRITADHLEVSQQGENGVRTFTAEGAPATYQQELEDGNLIRAEAEIIRYDENAETLTLLGNVKVTQANSEIQGNEIVYDFANQQLRARRGDDESDRVTTIFKPKNKNDNEPINR